MGSYRLIDATGKVVHDHVIPAPVEELEIVLDQFARGTYWLEMTGEQGQQVTTSVVLQ